MALSSLTENIPVGNWVIQIVRDTGQNGFATMSIIDNNGVVQVSSPLSQAQARSLESQIMATNQILSAWAAAGN